MKPPMGLLVAIGWVGSAQWIIKATPHLRGVRVSVAMRARD